MNMNPLKSESQPRSPRFSLKGRGSKAKLGIVIILVIILAIAALPAYWQGNWSNLSIAGVKLPVWEIKAPWQKPFPVQNLDRIRKVGDRGLEVSGWETLETGKLKIGGHDWSGQILRQSDRRDITLFLFPQTDPKLHPGVEWVDMDGFFKWKIDSQRPLNFAVETGEMKAKVRANLSLARESRRSPFGIPQTVAVVEWYSWGQGGHYSHTHWFWLDQRAQLKKKRIPWIAVTLRIPVDPKSTLDMVQSDVEALAKSVQASLMQNVFSSQN
ncbi:cyanoexosortase B system-associated protein [Spirulina sp. 06S082]|uniref:cyanoexosortase B system-associated protein n=1 Tax=Spirulina sp. 06S082 TaxID=3110248 RepID=UPI002B22023C|nr:cyanoexosortase B system-associated protein [Spirulina sp. 06S082]MEA5469241.1 cyanoexosortase B system-associated protein [Spirulina sp. 06S082]